MSPEPTSVAALSRTSDLFSHHNHLFSKEYNYTKPMQSITDKRTSTGSLSYLTTSLNNNNLSNTPESRHIQRQRQSLNGSHNLNNPQSQHRLSTEIHTATTLNIAESENSNTGRLEQQHLEQERQRLEQQIFEAQMKMLELKKLREEQDLLENRQSQNAGILVESVSEPNTPSALITNETRARSNTMPRLNTTTGNLVTNTNQFDSLNLESLSHNDANRRSNASSRSVPNSRRNSNESQETPSYLGGLSNRKDKSSENIVKKDNIRVSSRLPSLTLQDRNTISTNASNHDNSTFPQFNFLLEEDSASPFISSSSYVCRYLQMNTDDDKFPILVRRDSYPGMLSASSAALDLAPLPQSTSRHRGLDPITYRDQLGYLSSETLTSSKKTTPTSTVSTGTSVGSINVSGGMSYACDRKKLDNLTTVDNSNASKSQRVPKLSSSTPDLASAARLIGNFSLNTNDVILEANNQINHSVQLPNVNTAGDIVSNNVCRFYQQGYCQRGERCSYSHTNPFNGLGQANMNITTQMAGFQGVTQPMNNNAYYGQYGLGINMLPSTSGYNYSQSLALNTNPNNNTRLMHASNIPLSKMSQKRMSGDLEAVNRFAGIMLEDLVGEIYSLCKDQHGCRYLQKKLEEKNEQYIGLIFNEVFSHFVELMTDPFGNYLCQKLLEYCNDDQRTIIIETVAPELVNISLNMHGTRAVQKMIEFLLTPQQPHSNGYVIKKQIRTVIAALNPNVVTLVKDLNGNHVIQKCLNRLSSEDNQFIYNAVSKNCIEVATHRHGCCVLQRCIDHASESQKIQLVTEITYNALTLVQDPYGNYVVQYVLDLGDNRFTDSLIRKFIGNVCSLSVQKFSSNVMEKCIRVAEPETRKYLINELLNKNRLDKLLRDSFANYVVQTSLDYADQMQRAQLVECIRPLLPAIRNTPYGKRIQGKLHREQQQMHNALNSINSINMLKIQSLQRLGSLGNFTSSFSGNVGSGLIGMNDYATPSFRYI